MNRHSFRAATALALTACAVAFASTSRADEVVIVQEPPVRAHRSYGAPAVTSGIVVFGISYGSAVIVASTSTHRGDSHLFVPIVGPWLDFADRGTCGPLTNERCDNETTYKVLLAVDGVFQAIGVLSVVGGLLAPEGTTVVAKAPEKPKIQIAPAQYGKSGVGLAAVGTF